MTLKERLEQGEYHIDTKKVADAMLRSPLWKMLLLGSKRKPPGGRPAVG